MEWQEVVMGGPKRSQRHPGVGAGVRDRSPVCSSEDDDDDVRGRRARAAIWR